jgi:biotin carboxyl carrier protein
MQYRLLHSNEVYDVGIHKENDGFIVTIGDKEYEVSELAARDNYLTFKIGDHKQSMYFAQDDKKTYIALDGEYYIVERARPASSGSRVAGHEQENSIASPMPGLLVKLAVKVGDMVQVGDTLAIVEAMKMQNELRAPIAGRVGTVNFKEGDQVDALQTIVEIEPQEVQ